MLSDDQQNVTGCSRRNFLQISAGAIAGMALMSLPKVSLASPARITATTLKDCPIDALAVANGSEMVRNAYNKIISLTKSIKNTSLRRSVQAIIEDPAPTVMRQYTSGGKIERVYQTLLSEQLVDSSKITAKTLFPKCADANKAPQPFIAAPGSGYGSHHAYPGGLSTHTAANLCIADAVCSIYKEVFNYSVDRDVVIAAEALHDLAKPWVFQWNQDGSCLPELPIAGTGSHHILSIAESIYRGLPAGVVVAQACAHSAPGTKQDERDVTNWIKAAAIIADKNPISLGLLTADGAGIPTPHKQEGYIVHLADHDYVLSVPAAQKAVLNLQAVARSDYGMTNDDLNTLKFNKFRNYIGAQVSLMRVDHAMADGGSLASVKELVHSVIAK